jgi:DNA modification methylase
MDSRYHLHHGDCLEVLKTLPDCSVDAVVTDPPYGLSFMGKRWDYDVPAVEVWQECLRVLKPGGHLLAFAGTRTQHRMAVRIEDAGFEIRDLIAWVYGQGFPKSYNLDNNQGVLTCNCEGDTIPYTHEKELSRKPQAECQLSNMSSSDVSQAEHPGERGGEILQQGLQEQGSPIAGRQELWSSKDGFEQPGMERRGHAEKTTRQLQGRSVRSSSTGGAGDGEEGRLHNGASPSDGLYVRIPDDEAGSRQPHRPQPIEQRPEQPGALADERRPQARRVWPMCDRCSKPIIPKGLGTALKPAFEPVTMARKPFASTVAANVLEHGVGGLNVDGCRVGTDGGTTRSEQAPYAQSGWRTGHKIQDLNTGRWPANFIHDGSDESTGLLGDAARFFYTAKASKADRDAGCGEFAETQCSVGDYRTSGDFNERLGKTPATRRNHHPTVKPTDLMRYLCRLVTPPGGIVLDPFTGSGSTGKAAILEGFRFIGIEREAEYIEIARARIQREAEKPRQPTLFD